MSLLITVKMDKYETLYKEEFDIDSLPQNQKEFYERVKSFKEEFRPTWNEFNNFWRSHINTYLSSFDRKEIVNLPIYVICQDLEARIGIAMGYVRAPTEEEILQHKTGNPKCCSFK